MDMPPVTPQSNSSGKTVLIVVITLLVLCCLCTCLVGASAAALYMFNVPTQKTDSPMPEFLEPTFEFEIPTLDAPFPFDETPTEESIAPEETPTPALVVTPKKQVTPEETPAKTPSASGTGLGVSRQEMIDFFNVGDAFTFKDPVTIQGVEMVQGTHQTLCVKNDCAAVTLAGPEDDLQVVSVVAPTGSEHGQSLVAFTLLMNTSVRFIDPSKDGDIPLVIMQDLLSAVDDGKKLEKTFESNGYKLVETYDPKLHHAGLAITRVK